MPSKVFAQPTAASSGDSLVTRCKLSCVSSRFQGLLGDEDIEDDIPYCSENYAGNYADVGADGFAADEDLYAEKTYKRQNSQKFQKGEHAPSVAPSPASPVLCVETSRRPSLIEDPGRTVPRDRCDEMSPTGGDLLVTTGQASQGGP